MLPVIFGETVIDMFANGQEVLGGSAMNVAWGLSGLGLPTPFITRLGNDQLGQKYTQIMKKWSMNMDYVQIDSKFPTGTIEVYLNDRGEAKYQSAPVPVAIDLIELTKDMEKLGEKNLLYYGTYIMRGQRSRQTLEQLRSQRVQSFIDVNLRTPYWNKNQTLEMIHGAQYVKMNEDEFTSLCSIKHSYSSGDSLEVRAQDFREERKIKNLLLTLGEKGAYLLSDEKSYFCPAKILAGNFHDSVGAGDAFCAGFIYSLHLKLTPNQCLQSACAMASQICLIQGATTRDQNFYQKCRDIWPS